MRGRRRTLLQVGLVALVLASAWIGLATGRQSIDLAEAVPYDPASTASIVLFQLRLPRVLFAGLVGAALAGSGVVLQGVLRNPLATPFTLGIAGGASLGAVLAIHLGLDVAILGLSPRPFLAFAGALASIGVLYLLARGRTRISSTTLLLSGVTLNFLCGAGILLIQYVSDPFQTTSIVRWTMGDLSIVGSAVPIRTLPLVAIGLGLCLVLVRELDLLALGEDLAASRGVAVGRVRWALLVGASLATGGALAYAGPIAFVGLVVPHVLRRLVGPDHPTLLPASLPAGAAFLILADALARSIPSVAEIQVGELPIGVLTSLLGAPFFLWILRRTAERGEEV